MWIVGGDANQGHYQYDVWNSTDGKSWTYVNKGKPVPWGPRALHYTVAFKDKIWVMGGQTMPAVRRTPTRSSTATSGHSTDGVNWEQVTPKEPFWPQRGMIGGSAVLQGPHLDSGRRHLRHARRRPTAMFYNDVWSSADGVSWERHTEAAPWEPRQYHDVAVFDDRLWVLEGYSARPTATTSGTRPTASTGTRCPNTPWKPRHAASVFVHDNALWMVAGNNMESDVWRLEKVR